MWHQLTIESKAKQIDTLVKYLEAHQVLSISLIDKNDDTLLEAVNENSTLWPETIVEVLFDNLSQAEKMQALIQEQFNLLTKVIPLEERDWHNNWLNFAKPLCFANKLWIYPSFIKPPTKSLYLQLDPGLAFGTGSHPTTALCLNWLACAELKNKSIIDYGCGSGVLSLAALKLGASQVQAVDIDNQALIATSTNAKINGINQGLTVVSAESLVKPSDIIVANILLNPLLALKDRFKSHLIFPGILVITGILNHQQAILIDYYNKDFTLIAKHHLEEWSLLVWRLK